VSADIRGSKGNELSGKKVILCVTGSVAAIKAPEIARELIRRGADVWTAMTDDACAIIHPFTMQWATGNPVVQKITGKLEYLELMKNADLVLIAPTTAHTIGKVAGGLSDDCVSLIALVALGSNVPIVLAPAMHETMYKSPTLTENLEKLEKFGVRIVGPRLEEGKAKVAGVSDIVETVIDALTRSRNLEGKKVLITAGPTREYIDPIRFITNKSTGKMGVAIAREAIRRGANVTLIYGPGSSIPPVGAKVVNVETTGQMHEALREELKSKDYHVVILTAAVVDYTPREKIEQKLSTKEGVTLQLKPSPKVAEVVRRVNPSCYFVGFKAEYNVSNDRLIDLAYDRLKTYGMNLIVANDVGRRGSGFAVDTNEVFIIDESKNVIHVPLSPKRDVANKILDVVVKRLR
jgi:phosphopantothenoylcysteine decarboxylase/phosphopantothenate--cysteine ligase